MDKIKILVVPKNRELKNIKRIIKPHLNLQETYGDDFFIDIDLDANLDDDNYLAEYDVVVYHEYVETNFPSKLKELGIIGVLDIDDNWSLDKNNRFYKYIKHQELAIKENIRNSQFVTTSTESLFDKLIKLNENVTLINDSLDEKDIKTKLNTKKSKKLRLGLVVDEYSIESVQNLNGLISKLKSDKLLGDVQLVLCGFDFNMQTTKRNETSGENEKVKVKPINTPWFEYESILTNGHTTISDEYKEHLMSFSDEEFVGVEKEPYRRISKRSDFITYYGEFDVLLAPLSKNSYSEMTSPFRVMEAGFHKKAIIAQDYGPYTIDLINGYTKGGSIDLNSNALLVDPKKNHKEWSKYIKLLVGNPDAVKSLGKNLHNTVKNKYSMVTTNKLRKDFYKGIIKLIAINK